MRAGRDSPGADTFLPVNQFSGTGQYSVTTKLSIHWRLRTFASADAGDSAKAAQSTVTSATRIAERVENGLPEPAGRARPRRRLTARERGAVLVELEDADGAVRRGMPAQLAEHALVEVLLHDLDAAILALGVDVDGADLGQLRGERG